MKHKILLYPPALALSLVPAIFLNNLYGYLPFLFLVFTGLLSVLYGFILKKSISYIDVSELKSCNRDSEVDFSVSVQNKSFLIYPKIEAYFYMNNLFGEEDTVNSVSFTLTAFEKREFHFTVKFVHIGSYDAGLKQIDIYSLFNLHHFTLPNHKHYRIKVNPKIYNLPNLAVANLTQEKALSASNTFLMTGSDYTGVRSYEIGDPMKNIHWKLSARSLNYMTKQFESYASSGVSVILDLLAPPYPGHILMDIFDSLVETGLSVAHHAKKAGLEYEILYYKDRMPRRYHPMSFSHPDELMDDLPAITTDPALYDVSLLLGGHGRIQDTMGNIILCTANISDPILKTLIALKCNRKKPLLYFILPKDLHSEEIEDKIKPLKILDRYHIIYRALSSASDLRKAG